jgi:NTE family protein
MDSQTHAGAPPPDKIDGIALALSGGGFRAALFHLGVVERLYELGVLDDVGYLSTVSGGSVLGGLLAVNWSKLVPRSQSGATAFRDLVAKPLLEVAGADVRNRTVRRSLLPHKLLTNRGNVLASVLDDICFRGATLSDLPNQVGPGALRVAINATSLRSGKRFRFSKDSMGDYKCYTETGVEKVKVATAVAASAAFPPVFAPLVLPFPGPYFRSVLHVELR